MSPSVRITVDHAGTAYILGDPLGVEMAGEAWRAFKAEHPRASLKLRRAWAETITARVNAVANQIGGDA